MDSFSCMLCERTTGSRPFLRLADHLNCPDVHGINVQFSVLRNLSHSHQEGTSKEQAQLEKKFDETEQKHCLQREMSIHHASER